MDLNECLNISFPEGKYNQGNLKTMKLKVIMLQNQNLNITTSYLICNETNNINCKYGCLSVYDSLNNSYQEISITCHSNERYKLRNIYSHTFYVSLVFYSYPEYGKFSISVFLSGTSCKIVTINACTL